MHAKREKSMLRKVALWDGGGLAEVRRKVAGYCTADNGVGATSVQGLTADRTHVNKPTYSCSSHAMVGDGKARESAKPALYEINPPSWLPQFSDSVELGG